MQRNQPFSLLIFTEHLLYFMHWMRPQQGQRWPRDGLWLLEVRSRPGKTALRAAGLVQQLAWPNLALLPLLPGARSQPLAPEGQPKGSLSLSVSPLPRPHFSPPPPTPNPGWLKRCKRESERFCAVCFGFNEISFTRVNCN